MNLCFLGSGVEIENTLLAGVDIDASAKLYAKHFDTLAFGGSLEGLMGAFAKAFKDNGGKIISIVPKFLIEADYVFDSDEIHYVNDSSERKRLMFSNADAILCYPGGVGTYDELFDYLAKHAISDIKNVKKVYMYNFEKFYSPLLLQIQTATELGLVKQKVIDKLVIYETIQQLYEVLG